VSSDPPAGDAAWRSAAVASLVPLLAVAGAAIGALAADALDLTSADARYVAVGLGAAVPLLLGHVLRPDAKLRAVTAVAGAAWLAAIALPRSALAVTWLSGGLLCMGAVAIGHAARSAWRVGAVTASRVGLAALAAGPGLYFLAAASVLMVNNQMVVAPVRLFHLAPPLADGEEAVTLRTADGYRLEATYAPGEPGAGAVALIHGVSDGRERWRPWVRRLRDMGVHSLRIDVRGHGRSEGAVVTYGQREHADVRAAVAWLRARPGVDPARVIVVGTSMGGGSVLAATRGLPVRAAIAMAPASSYPRLVRQRTALLGPLAVPVLNGTAHVARAMGQQPMTTWRPIDRMSRTLPILIAHGRADATIPIELSRDLARRRPNVGLYELDCGHDEIPARTANEPHWRTMRIFLLAHLQPDDD